MGINISEFFDRQLQVWDTARNNFEALKNVKVKEFNVDGTTIKVQFNPGRIVSSAAKVDAKSLKERKCFLCAANRPAVQEGIAWGDDYTILINPFPIFPRHLTIPCNKHVDQLIKGRIADMMNLSRDLEGFTLFYNGPKCGASAPDHMHFQAGNRGFMPMEDQMASAERDIIVSGGSVELSIVKGMSHPCFCIRTSAVDKGEKMFDLVYNVLTIPEGEPEPMLNVLCWYEDGLWTILVFPRKKHRPSCYAAEGDATAAMLMAAMLRLCGQAGFSEMYMMDFAREAILLCHAGEGNWAMCRRDKKPFLMDRVFNEGGLSNPPTPIFTPEPGPAGVMSLVHVGGERFRLVYAPGEILDECSLRKIDMPYMFFRPASGVRACIKAWLEQGGTHHEIIVPGDYAARVRLLCRLLGIEFVEV